MHELSIAQSIVEIAEQQAQSRNASEIEEVELEIGALAGIEISSLEFALETCVKGTMLENARIVRRDIAGEGCCSGCGRQFPLENLFTPCPACGSYAIKVLKGKELRIKSIVVK
ncbi:MAG: hydrogenase maturation nickel metallochaperone HypA [Dysgonamonadaceae bacterium]|jgi:hydrogenase nickel incorporation protein HypA/HybF|nr:hydrogenase maturation nickel metallochaperone HypA [Dysgonamonadaceae bacterium]